MTDHRRDVLRSPTEERNPRTEQIDQLGSRPLVDLVLGEDRGVVAAVEAAAGALAELVDHAVRAVDDGHRLHYVGSGTSGRLGVLDAVELLPTYDVGEETVRAHLAGGLDALVHAAEGAEDDDAAGAELAGAFSAGDLVIGIAASGRTPYVGGALRAARRVGAATGLITNNPHAPLAEHSDVIVALDTGPEVVTGSTRMRAATAQKIALNTFSTAAMVRLGRTYSNLMISVRATNEKLRARTVRMLVQASGAEPDRCAAVLEAAGREVRPALVALLAGTDDIAAARTAAERFPPDPDRTGDPAGVRAAVAALGAVSPGGPQP